jgi:hypothetical protein
MAVLIVTSGFRPCTEHNIAVFAYIPITPFKNLKKIENE